MKDSFNPKKQIYKGARLTSILDFSKKNSNIKQSLTCRNNYHSSNYKHTHFKVINSPKLSPIERINLTEKFEFHNIEKNQLNFSNKKSNISRSPFSNPNLNMINFKKANLSPTTSIKTNIFSPDKQILTDEKKKINKRIEHETKVKMIFYFLISLIYFSLYLLFIKILYKLSMPQIPPLGTSLFIISLNNAIFSIIFISIDQMNYLEYLYFKIILSNVLKMVINFISILLTIISLEKLDLIVFIILTNMKPLTISFMKVLDSNKTFKIMDTICYFLFILIFLIEFFLENTISIICILLLIAINIIGNFPMFYRVKSLHPYFSIFGSSLIGLSISPIIMILMKDILIISFSQYLLFFILSFSYFFSVYFLSKHKKYSFGKKFKIYGSILNYILFIIYSIWLLREDKSFYTYIIFLISFSINIYAILRKGSLNL